MTAIRKFYKVKLSRIFMRKEMFFILGIFLINLIGGVSAVSSTTWVDFSVCVDGDCYEDVFDCSVDNFEVDDKGHDWVSLIWDNCESDRFSHNLIFVEGDLLGQTSDEFFNVTNLSEDKSYYVYVIPVSDEDEEGVRTGMFVRTLAGDDEEEDDEEEEDEEEGSDGGSNEDKRTGARDDVVPNFFVSRDNFSSEAAVITLGEYSSVSEGFDLWTLFWIALGFLIFVLLILIFVLLMR
jgi:hypothetical protein